MAEFITAIEPLFDVENHYGESEEFLRAEIPSHLTQPIFKVVRKNPFDGSSPDLIIYIKNSVNEWAMFGFVIATSESVDLFDIRESKVHTGKVFLSELSFLEVLDCLWKENRATW